MTATAEEHTIAAPARAPAGGISRALVEAGVLTPKQLAYAERVHAKLGVERPLITLLRELFPITDVQVREALRRKGESLRLGELLMELGYLREEFLDLALTIQREDPTQHRRVGQILIEHHLIDEQQLVEALALHLGFALEVPGRDPIDASLFAPLPIETCERFCIVPLRREERGVVVAFSDPTDRDAMAAAEQAFGADSMVPAIAERAAIRAALSRAAGNEEPTAAGAAPPPAIVDLLDELIEDAIEGGASTIHLEPRADGVAIRQREAGVLVARSVLPLSLAPALVNHVRFLCRTLDRAQDGDCHFVHQHGDRPISVSIAACPSAHGERIVLRLAEAHGSQRGLDALGVPVSLVARLRSELAASSGGLWLLAGPMGSGRSTTFHSLVSSLATPITAVATIEQGPLRPIEGALQLRLDRDAAFGALVSDALRQDPDLIGVDEVQGDEAARRLVTIAATGRRVIAVASGDDAPSAAIAFASRGVDRPLWASALGGIVAQRLLRRICGDCAQSDGSRAARQLEERVGAEAGRFRSGRGCNECNGAGYRGSIAIFELFVPDAQQRWLLARGCTALELQRGAAANGPASLFEQAVARAADGIVSAAEVLRTTRVPEAPRALAAILERTGS